MQTSTRALHRIRPHLTYANVVSTLALVSMLTGTAMAATALKRSSVTGAHVKNGSLTSADIKNRSLRGVDVKSGSIGRAQLAAGVRESLNERGERGPQGVRGMQGEQGPAGEQGVAGPQGATGAQGPQGTLPLVSPNGQNRIELSDAGIKLTAGVHHITLSDVGGINLGSTLTSMDGITLKLDNTTINQQDITLSTYQTQLKLDPFNINASAHDVNLAGVISANVNAPTLSMMGSGIATFGGGITRLGCAGGLPVARGSDAISGTGAGPGNPITGSIVSSTSTVLAC